LPIRAIFPPPQLFDIGAANTIYSLNIMNFCASSKCFYLKRIGNGKNFAIVETMVGINPPPAKQRMWVTGILLEEKNTSVHHRE
jgi:hypothetical protein